MKLQAIVTQYVAFRKSLGEGFRSNEQVLKSFSHALGDRLDVGEVQAAQVDAFLAGTGPLTSSITLLDSWPESLKMRFRINWTSPAFGQTQIAPTQPVPLTFMDPGCKNLTK